MEALRIIAASWPIAATVIGIGFAIVIRRCFKQAMDNTEKMNEYRAGSAVAVQSQDRYRDE